MSEDEAARRVLAESEQAVGFAELRAYLPWLDPEQYDEAAMAADPYAHPVGALRRILVETRVYDRLAEDLWTRRQPDVLVLYVQGTDAIGHHRDHRLTLDARGARVRAAGAGTPRLRMSCDGYFHGRQSGGAFVRCGLGRVLPRWCASGS